MIRVLIADDHEVVRLGLSMLVDAEPDLELVGCAVDGLEVVDLAARLRPDVVLIDLSMPVLDGFAAISWIRAVCPDACVVALTAYSREECLQQAVTAGAVGCLLKDRPPADVIRAIRSRGHSTRPVAAA